MNKRKAIDILHKQIVKLGQDNFNNKTWTIQTKTYLESFFGKESEQYQYFHKYYWSLDYASRTKPKTIEMLKHTAETLLNDCIDTIDDLGLKKQEPKGNIISRMSDKWAVTIVLGLITFAFWLGTTVCK